MKTPNNTLLSLALAFFALSPCLVQAATEVTPQWSAPVDLNAEHGHAIVVKNGFVYACGVTEHAGSEQVVTVKYDTAGTGREWIRYLPISVNTGGPEDEDTVCDLAVLGNNTYVMTRDRSRMILVKYDENGNEKWVKDDFGSVWDGTTALAARSGRIFLGGSAVDTDYGWRFTIARYKTDGTRLWKKTLSSSEQSFLASLAADTDGNVCAVGSRGADLLAVKYSPSGAKLWEKTYTGLAGGFSSAYAVAAPTASGPVYVVGISSTDGGGKEYVTIKHTHSGQRAWVRRFSPGDGVTSYYQPMIAARGSKVYACATIGVGNGVYRVKTFAYDANGGPGVYGMESWVKDWRETGTRIEARSLVVGSSAVSQSFRDFHARTSVIVHPLRDLRNWNRPTETRTGGVLAVKLQRQIIESCATLELIGSTTID